QFARGYLNSRDLMGGWGTIVPDDAARRVVVAEAAANVFARDATNAVRDRPIDVIAGELALLSQHGLDDRDAYRAAAVQSHEELDAVERDSLFDIYEEYLRVRAASEDGEMAKAGSLRGFDFRGRSADSARRRERVHDARGSTAAANC